jgi:hypothetical protein
MLEQRSFQKEIIIFSLFQNIQSLIQIVLILNIEALWYDQTTLKEIRLKNSGASLSYE